MIMKIIGVLLLCALMCVVLRQAGRNESAMLLAASGCVFGLAAAFSMLQSIVAELSLLASSAGLDNEIYLTVLKITGVAYITQNGASLCKDVGESALSEKIELGGKIMICMMSVPSVKALLDVVSSLL